MLIPDYLAELLFVFGLIICNGFFAASEIAIISLPKIRIKQLIAKNEKKAEILMNLQNNPDILFATVQVGVSLTSILASTFAGATLTSSLAYLISLIPISFLQNYAGLISFALVVILIFYFSLVIGELVPKSLALQHNEKLALFTASYIYFLSKITHPLVQFLTISKNIFLKLIGQKTHYNKHLITEEEIKFLVNEGREKGVFDKTEQEIIQKVFTFTDTVAKEIMTPRIKIQAIEINASKKEIITTFSKIGVSRFPVYEKNLDNIVGILHNKEVFKVLAKGEKINLAKLMEKPTFVPETELLSHLLKKMQKQHQHLVIVVDEYGIPEGLISIQDILEELVGRIQDEKPQKNNQAVKEIKKNIFIIDGVETINFLNEKFNFNLPDNPNFETLAGFMLSQLQAVPKKGQKIQYKNMVLSVEKTEENRISKVKIEIGKETQKKSF